MEYHGISIYDVTKGRRLGLAAPRPLPPRSQCRQCTRLLLPVILLFGFVSIGCMLTEFCLILAVCLIFQQGTEICEFEIRGRMISQMKAG